MQGTHAVPFASAYDPALQAVQFVPPAEDATVPEGHATHVDEFGAAYVPAEHVVQTVVFRPTRGMVLATSPCGQTVHW